MREIVGVERKSRKRPSQTYFLFFLQNCTIHDVDNAESSRLIKLVHAVQSLKRREKKRALMSYRESGQIIKYKLISVLNPCWEQWIAFRKLKRYGWLPHSVRVYHVLLEKLKENTA